MRLVYRPIDVWPGELTPAHQRQQSPFTATWTDTCDLLQKEVSQLTGYRDAAAEVVLQVAGSERDMRLDGGLRADARPIHPGVILSFKTKRHGPLKYSTDVFTDASYRRQVGWQANVRAIALGLEALRKVERYGIARRGEQYVGWAQLPPAPVELGEAAMTVEDAARFLIQHGEWGGTPAAVDKILGAEPDIVAAYFRSAAKKLHPDVGGDPALFRRLGRARELLLAAS